MGPRLSGWQWLFDFHTARYPVTAISACLSIQCSMRPSLPLLYFCDADITICQKLSRRLCCSPRREKIERILHHPLRAKRQTALVQTSHGGFEEIKVYEHFVSRNNCHKWREIWVEVGVVNFSAPQPILQRRRQRLRHMQLNTLHN